ncbi:MAG: hypothetical protein SWY16_04115 [Cyanobacteriota bacterium]|nr:hypothetical protein [Cyanobacteriota bacterium]
MKLPFGLPVWGWVTLLASLGIHGGILSLPITLNLDTPEPEPETLAAVPLATLPVISPPSSEPEMTEVESAAEPEDEVVWDETEEQELEYAETEGQTYKPEPIESSSETPSQTPLETRISPRSQGVESPIDAQQEVKPAAANAASVPSKKRRLDRAVSQNGSNEVGESTSSSTEDLEQSLTTALDAMYSGISNRLSSLEDDEDKQGSLEKNPQMISNLLLFSGQLASQFFDGEATKDGVIQVTLVQNPEKQNDEIEIQKLYEDFVEPSLLEQGFQVSPITTQAEKKLYQANKESLERRVLLVAIPPLTRRNDPGDSRNFGTFIVVYDPNILQVEIDI